MNGDAASLIRVLKDFDVLQEQGFRLQLGPFSQLHRLQRPGCQ